MAIFLSLEYEPNKVRNSFRKKRSPNGRDKERYSLASTFPNLKEDERANRDLKDSEE
jgi:hypothetical protein